MTLVTKQSERRSFSSTTFLNPALQECESETLPSSIDFIFSIFKGLFIMDLFILDIYCMLYEVLQTACELCSHAMCCKVTLVTAVVTALGRPLQSKCIVKAFLTKFFKKRERKCII